MLSAKLEKLIKLVEAINCPDEPKKPPKKEIVAKAPVAAKKTAPVAAKKSAPVAAKKAAPKDPAKTESPKKESASIEQEVAAQGALVRELKEIKGLKKGDKQFDTALAKLLDLKGRLPKASKPSKKQQQKKGKKQQQKKGKGQNNNDQPLITRFDFRVGRIVEVELHPNADSMYLEKIDMGDAEPRVVISGLVKHVPIEEMRDSLVVTFANLKPAKLRGIPSNAMVFAAHGPDGKVELIRPPPGAKVGERIWIEGFENITDFPPDASINCKKKNAIWNKIKPDLMTNADGAASYQGKVFLCSGGPMKAATIKNGPIS